MSWLASNFDTVWSLLLQHARLSLLPIALGVLLAIPLGRLAATSRTARGIVLTGGSTVYALPSLPLFLMLPLILGTRILDEINVVVALTLYAVAIMVRSATDAFQSLPSATLAAATATGYSTFGRFLRVEMPLAGPVLLAGARVVSVSTIALLSVGTLIGVGNLGTLFMNGWRTDNLVQVLVGLAATLALAGVFDAVLVLLGRVLLPWRKAVR